MQVSGEFPAPRKTFRVETADTEFGGVGNTKHLRNTKRYVVDAAPLLVKVLKDVFPKNKVLNFTFLEDVLLILFAESDPSAKTGEEKMPFGEKVRRVIQLTDD